MLEIFFTKVMKDYILNAVTISAVLSVELSLTTTILVKNGFRKSKNLMLKL
jgi:hypothetical protein